MTVLYRFDAIDRFPLLRSYTTASGPVNIHTEGSEAECVLRVCAVAHSSDPAAAQVVLALPLLGVDGDPKQLLLDLDGDGDGSEVFIEAMDGSGRCVTYSLGTVDFQGRGTCSADARRAREVGASGGGARLVDVSLPIQFCRLGFVLRSSGRGMNVGLIALRVTGAVRFPATGIAGGVGHNEGGASH